MNWSFFFPSSAREMRIIASKSVPGGRSLSLLLFHLAAGRERGLFIAFGHAVFSSYWLY